MADRDATPKPQRRLMRTLLKRPRNLRQFAPRLSFEEVAARIPPPSEAAQWGQVVLLGDVIVALHRDGTVSRLFHTVMLLFGDQELAQWDEVTRRYDPRISLETILHACVHLPGGQVHPAQLSTAQLDAHRRLRRLTFAPLRPGVILEFEEQFDRFRPFELAPGLWSQIFLQGPAPRQRTRLTVAVARPFEATIRVHHCDWQPAESAIDEYRVWQWDLRDLPGVEFDEWTPPARDFVPWVDVTTLPSWRPIAQYYEREIVPAEPAPAELCRRTAELTASTPRDHEKVAAIYKYATRDVRYGRHPREVDLEIPRSPGQMLADLRGDCKDKSALVVSMLRQLNIQADIALVQSRVNGTTPSLPAPWFDHALVRVLFGDVVVWLDPAGGPYTFGDIPYYDQGIETLVLDGNGATRCRTPAPQPQDHAVDCVCRGQLAASGSYTFTARVTATGEEAVSLRLKYLHRRDEQRRRLLAQNLAVAASGAMVGEARFLQLDDLTQPVVYEYHMTLDHWARQVEDLLLFHPPWSQCIRQVEPIAASQRSVPLAAPSASSRHERHELTLPDGWTGYGLPSSVSAECPWGRYSCRLQLEGSALVCERGIEHEGGMIPVERYPEFQRFWQTCARGESTEVILKKT